MSTTTGWRDDDRGQRGGVCRTVPSLSYHISSMWCGRHGRILLVGGLVAIFYFPIYWVSNHPNWLSYFSEGWPNHQPDCLRSTTYLINSGTTSMNSNTFTVVHWLEARGKSMRWKNGKNITVVKIGWVFHYEQNCGYSQLELSSCRLSRGVGKCQNREGQRGEMFLESWGSSRHHSFQH